MANYKSSIITLVNKPPLVNQVIKVTNITRTQKLEDRSLGAPSLQRYLTVWMRGAIYESINWDSVINFLDSDNHKYVLNAVDYERNYAKLSLKEVGI